MGVHPINTMSEIGNKLEEDHFMSLFERDFTKFFETFIWELIIQNVFFVKDHLFEQKKDVNNH